MVSAAYDSNFLTKLGIDEVVIRSGKLIDGAHILTPRAFNSHFQDILQVDGFDLDKDIRGSFEPATPKHRAGAWRFDQ